MPTYLHVLTVQVLSGSKTIPRLLSGSDGTHVADVERLGDPVALTAEELDALTQKESA